MPQSLANLTVHLIFSTKNRQPLLVKEVRPALHAYIATVLENTKCPALIINSVGDHIHILFQLHRTIALSQIVEDLKKSSSKWLKTQNVHDFAWQAGYGAFSVSQSQIEEVKHYIENQERHHQQLTFQNELRNFLKKNEIAHDEKYLWD